MWAWNIVCPAVSPLLTPILKPSGWNFFYKIVLTFLTNSKQLLYSSSFKSNISATILFGKINACPFDTGNPSYIENDSWFSIIFSLSKNGLFRVTFLILFLINAVLDQILQF